MGRAKSSMQVENSGDDGNELLLVRQQWITMPPHFWRHDAAMTLTRTRMSRLAHPGPRLLC